MIGLMCVFGGSMAYSQGDDMVIAITTNTGTAIDIVQERLDIVSDFTDTGKPKVGTIDIVLTDTNTTTTYNVLRATGYSANASPEWNSFITAGDGLYLVCQNPPAGYFSDRHISIKDPADPLTGNALAEDVPLPVNNQQTTWDVYFNHDRFQSITGGEPGTINGGLQVYYHTE